MVLLVSKYSWMMSESDWESSSIRNNYTFHVMKENVFGDKGTSKVDTLVENIELLVVVTLVDKLFLFVELSEWANELELAITVTASF